MSSDQPRRRESSGSPGSPMGSTAAIIIAILAVVAGFLILRQIGGDDDNGDGLTSSETTTPTSTVPQNTQPTVPITTTPPSTTFVPVVDGATVVVANASTVNGAAKQLTLALTGKQFTMAEPTNASLKVDASLVYYDPADPEAQAVAASVAVLMGNVEVSAMPTPPPVKDGQLATGVSVLVMLGNDKASKTLDEMGGATTTQTTTPGGSTGSSTGSSAP